MASPYLRVLSLVFMLIVLYMHHCSARKVLLEDMNKQEKAQPKYNIKPSPMAHKDMKNQEKNRPKDDIKAAPMAHEDMNKQEESQPNDDVKIKPPMAHETDHELAQKNNETSGEIGIECGGGGCEAPCFEEPCNGGGEVIIQPPGQYVPTPPIVVRQPPHIEYPPPVVVLEPTPCTPCEPWYGPEPCPCPCEEGYNAKTEGIKTEGGAHKDESDNKAKEGEMQGRPVIGIPAPSLVADAPMAAISHGSNVHA